VKLLLDTHIYLWAINEAERHSPTAQAAIRDSTNELYPNGNYRLNPNVKIGAFKHNTKGGQ